MVAPRLAGALLLAAFSHAQQAPQASQFGRELWTKTRGLFSRDNLLPLLAGSAFTGASTLADDEVRGYFAGQRRARWIGEAGNYLGNPITVGAAAGTLFFASYKTGNQRFRSFSFDLSQGVVLDYAVTAGFKAATRRERPDASNRLSFPSGHASSTLTAATVIAHHYPKAAIPAYLLAGFTAFSRIEKNRHWLSDTIAGAAQGYLIGRTVLRRNTGLRTGRLELNPCVSPRGFWLSAEIHLGRGSSGHAASER